MSAALSPVFSKKFPGADSFSKSSDGKAIVISMPRLDEICAAKGLTPLSTFAPDIDAIAEELPEGEVFDGILFSSTDGLRSVSGVIKALQSEKEWSKGIRKNDVGDLLRDLKELERLLKTAKQKRSKFYLLYC